MLLFLNSSLFIIFALLQLFRWFLIVSNIIFFLFLGIVTTWRTARSETPLGVVGVAAVVAADPSPPLSSTYVLLRAGFTMVSRMFYVYHPSRHILFLSRILHQEGV